MAQKKTEKRGPKKPAKKSPERQNGKPSRTSTPKNQGSTKPKEESKPITNKKKTKDMATAKNVRTKQITAPSSTVEEEQLLGPQIPQGETLQRYSDADLEEFREIVERKLTAAKKDYEFYDGLITGEGNHSLESGGYAKLDESDVQADKEYNSQMASRLRLHISNLQLALGRINNKTYGVCRITGKLIDRARLKAVPHATLSMEGKAIEDKHKVKK